MAISVLGTPASPYVRTPRADDGAREADAAPALRRVPVPALVAGVLSVVQAVGLLAGGLDGIDGVLATPARPAGLLIVGGLVALAGWIVLAAGGGAALIDGANRRLLVLTSSVELFVVAVVGAFAVARGRHQKRASLADPDPSTPGVNLAAQRKGGTFTAAPASPMAPPAGAARLGTGPEGDAASRHGIVGTSTSERGH